MVKPGHPHANAKYTAYSINFVILGTEKARIQVVFTRRHSLKYFRYLYRLHPETPPQTSGAAPIRAGAILAMDDTATRLFESTDKGIDIAAAMPLLPLAHHHTHDPGSR